LITHGFENAHGKTCSVAYAELGELLLKRAEEIEREVHEGRGHSGMSAVVQVVAKKL